MAEEIQSPEQFFGERGEFREEAFYNSTQCRELKSDGSNVFHYLPDAGRWKMLNGTALIRHLLGLFPSDLRGKIPISALERVGKKLKMDPDRVEDFESFAEKGRFLINVRNGVIRVKSRKLEEHKKGYYFTYCCNFNYIPDADISQAEAFAEFCRTSLNGSKEAIKRLLQMIGYTISSLEGAEKFFILLGPSNCGKSVILNLTEHIVGSENIQAFPLSTVTEKQNLAELRYSRVNINRELSGQKIAHPDVLKSIISNERVTGERKFCQPENFTVHTKLCFAGNALPPLCESDEANAAILGRMCLLRFPHSISEEAINHDLFEEMLKEVDIIASAAVNTLNDLIQANYIFENDPISEDFMSVYEDYSKVLEQFIADRFDFGADKRVHSRTITAEYDRYCRDNGYDKTSTNRELSNYVAGLEGVKRDKFRIDRSMPLSGFKGIGLKQ